METLTELVRRMRFLWALLFILISIGLPLGLLAQHEKFWLAWACALVFPNLAWTAPYWRWPVGIRLSGTTLGAVGTFAALEAPFDARGFIAHAPEILLTGLLASVAVGGVAFLLTPLFRRS